MDYSPKRNESKSCLPEPGKAETSGKVVCMIILFDVKKRTRNLLEKNQRRLKGI